MICSCFDSDPAPKLRKKHKRPTVFHWPNFTWTHSEHNLRHRQHHHSRFFHFGPLHLGPTYHHNIQSVDERGVPLKTSRSRNHCPTLLGTHIVDETRLEHLGDRRLLVHFKTPQTPSQQIIRELLLHGQICTTRFDELTILGRISNHLTGLYTHLLLGRLLRIDQTKAMGPPLYTLASR